MEENGKKTNGINWFALGFSITSLILNKAIIEITQYNHHISITLY